MEKRDFFGYEEYTLCRGRMALRVITLGAAVTALSYAGRPLVLGYPDARDYREGTAYLGAIVGRYANRIAGARCTLDGKEIGLVPNEGPNQLHGGPAAFDKRRWTAEPLGAYSLALHLFSPAGDNGYPGNLNARVVYTLEEGALRIDLEGESDGDSIYGPTSHMYFDLSGKGNVLETKLWLNAKKYLPVDRALLPAGPALPTEGAFDFSELRPLGRDYDHAFLLAGAHGARAEAGGVRMDVFTDYPAIQLYTGSALSGRHGPNAGFCLEPEFEPDSPHRTAAESPVLRAGERFHRYIRYVFSETD